MKIPISAIHTKGLELSIDSKNDRWFDETVRAAFAERFPSGHAAEGHMRLVRTCENVTLGGLLEVDLSLTCDRCLGTFAQHLKVPLHIYLAPRPSPDSDDDLDFSFYKGDEIDLSDILRETLLLEVPFRYLCSESCKGLCAKCGKNLNAGLCGCPSETPTGPFTKLKKLIH